jgi:probable F420-dependent oxidoreductase
MTHPFRFSVQLSKAASRRDWADQARKAESLGYSAVTLPDHFGDQLAPIAALMAAADATSTLKIGTLVFDNDYRHPLILAKEAATLDLLSEGRLELGLGAGWMRSDYDQSGIAYDRPAQRIDRFEEGVTVIKGLMGDDPFSFNGGYYQIDAHNGLPKPVQRPHPPIIIGGGGRRILSIAAREADIVSINANLKEGLGGAEVAPNLAPEMTTRKVDWVREAAGSRFADVELHVAVGLCLFTDDPHAMAEAMAPAFGISAEEALRVPVALLGTVDSMVEELQHRREEWGFSYISIEGPWEEFASVVARLTGT